MDQQQLHTLSKGWVTDFSPFDQPEHSYSFALNAAIESVDGDRLSIQTEPGTDLITTLPGKVYGVIQMADDELCVFYQTDTEGGIGILKKEVFNSLVQDSCLQFTHPIKGEFRLIKGCERVVYWYDGFNPDRFINLDRLSEYFDGNDFICDLTLLNSAFTYPQAEVTVQDFGGTLEAGTYQLVMQYTGQSTSDWVLLGNSIAIHDDSMSSPHYSIDGAYSLAGGQQALNGAVPPTNKSIVLNLTDLDTRFSDVRIGIVRYSTGDGETNEFFEIVTLPNNTTLNYTINRIGSSAIPRDIDNVSVVNPSYPVSKAMTQSSNRLIRANLKERAIDHYGLQQIANDIQVGYKTNSIIVNYTDISDPDDGETNETNRTRVEYGTNANLEFDPKSGEYYFKYGSYLRDEVYALGITFIFEDGSKSPVYHIPGREADLDSRIDVTVGNANEHSRNPGIVNNWDKYELLINTGGSNANNTTPIENVKHLGLTATDTVERWRVYNTAIRLDSTGGVNTGILAYYEADTDYPNVTDCQGNRVYPEGKIRHHRMPDGTLEPIINYTSHDIITRNILSLTFDNIDFSAYPDIVGYKIVRADRTDDNKTVIDHGIYYGTTGAAVNNDANNPFRFQRSRFNDPNSEAEHNNSGNRFAPDVFDVGDCALPGKIDILAINEDGTTNAGDTLIPMIDYAAVHSIRSKFLGQTQTATHMKYDRLYSTTSNSTGAQDTTPNQLASQKRIASYKEHSVPATGLANRQITEAYYIPANSVVQTTSITFNNSKQQELLLVKGEDIEDWADTAEDTQTYLITLKREGSVYTNIDSLAYYPVSQFLSGTTAEVHGGDGFIGFFSFKQTYEGAQCGTTDKQESDYRNLISFFTESDINFTLRHASTADCTGYWPKSFANATAFVASEDTDGLLCDNTYNYNEDYNILLNTNRAYFPLSTNYDYCSDCNNEFPHSYIWSDVALDEDLEDNYLNFRAANIAQVPGHTGQITNVVQKDNNSLIILTEASLYTVPINHQELQTSQANLYIGSGEFLSVPPVQFTSTKHGVAGSRSRFTTIVTEYGTMWVDQVSRKVYQVPLGSGPRPISDLGMSKWFEQNLKSYLEDYFYTQTGQNYPDEFLDNVYSTYGIGIIAGYDPMLKRYIIHKRDYLPLFEFTRVNSGGSTELYGEGEIIFDVSDNCFKIVELVNNVKVFRKLLFDDIEQFEDKSWTVSFSLKDNMWVSAHTYFPSYMANDTQHMFSFARGLEEGVYRHGSFTSNFLHNRRPDHIIEFVVRSPRPFWLNQVSWVGAGKRYNEEYGQYVEEEASYTGAMVYNSKQNSGFIELTPEAFFENSNYSYANILTNFNVLAKERKVYKFATFRDMVTDYTIPHLTSNWTDTQDNYYIDKVPSAAVSEDKNQYEQGNLLDTWHAIRLYDTTGSGRRVILDLAATKSLYT